MEGAPKFFVLIIGYLSNLFYEDMIMKSRPCHAITFPKGFNMLD